VGLEIQGIVEASVLRSVGVQSKSTRQSKAKGPEAGLIAPFTSNSLWTGGLRFTMEEGWAVDSRNGTDCKLPLLANLSLTAMQLGGSPAVAPLLVSASGRQG